MEDNAHRAYQDHLLARIADVLELDVDLDRRSRAGLDRAIARCAACPGAAGCKVWFERHRAGAAAAPDQCRNRDTLARLRARG